jgi:hypothetical protein
MNPKNKFATEYTEVTENEAVLSVCSVISVANKGLIE